MIEALKKSGSKTAKLTTLNKGHGIMGIALNDKELFPWMMKQSIK